MRRWKRVVAWLCEALGCRDGQRTPSAQAPEPQLCEPPRQVPDRIAPEELAPLLGGRITGALASGAEQGGGGDASRVVWVDGGDEVIVHVDSLKTAMASNVLLVAIDLESDEIGRQTLVVPLAPGTSPDDEMTLVTEAVPRGHGELAARWGAILQDAIFAALEDLARTHAAERLTAAKALVIADGALAFRAESPS